MLEEEIRPEKIFKEYLTLAENDVEIFFRKSAFYYVSCPACGHNTSILQFRKKIFDYEECTHCHTLFVNPRPTHEAFNSYYSDSSSVRFWATNFYKETESSRREKVIRPKAELVNKIINTYFPDTPENATIIDIGSGYGIFCEEIKFLSPKLHIIGIEPAKSFLSVCKDKNGEIIPKFIEYVEQIDLKGHNIIAATSFECHIFQNCKILEVMKLNPW